VLAGRIKDRAIAWSVASASVEEIDRLNIFHASMLAMRRAVEALAVATHEAWIDGNQCQRELPCRSKAIVDGDALHPVISAASILAKTARDAEMCALHERYPGYGFDRHKGYATSDHLDSLGRHGPCEIHRRSFYAVGVFFQGDLFGGSWSGMDDSLRVRSYRLYCEAMKLAAAKEPLSAFDAGCRRLRREYADVFASRAAASHVDEVARLFQHTRAELKARAAKKAN